MTGSLAETSYYEKSTRHNVRHIISNIAAIIFIMIISQLLN